MWFGQIQSSAIYVSRLYSDFALSAIAAVFKSLAKNIAQLNYTREV